MNLSKSKGQSAIEYLTTYGWMLLVIAIVGGAIFTTIQNSSQIQSTSGLANADVQIEQFGVTNNGLEAELRAASADQIENANISLIDEETGETVYSSKEVTMPVGGTETVTFPNITSSETTNTYQVKITYDTGGLNDLTVEGTITGNIETSSTSNTQTASSSAIAISGGSLTAMATTSTFGNSTSEICIGPGCSSTSGSSTEKVSISGDVMTGTLYVDNITDKQTTCFGDLCASETGSNTGKLGEDSSTMNGTLNVTEIMPNNQGYICAGTRC